MNTTEIVAVFVIVIPLWICAVALASIDITLAKMNHTKNWKLRRATVARAGDTAMRAPFAKRVIYLRYQRHVALQAARVANPADVPIFVAIARKAHARILQLLTSNQG